MVHLSIHRSFKNYYRSLLADLGISHRELKVYAMRKVACVLIVAYVFMLLKPVMPVIADAMAHTFWKSKHMLTVHEVHGKFHLHQEVVKASSQAEKDHSKGYTKVQVEDNLFVLPTVYAEKLSIDFQAVILYSCFICPRLYSFSGTFYPPPRI